MGVEPVYSDEEQDEPEQPEEEDFEDEEEEEEDESEGKSDTSSHAESGFFKRQSGTPTPPKLGDARARDASNLLLLNGVHLGHVITILEKQCPAALESDRLQLPERMEIVIGKI